MKIKLLIILVTFIFLDSQIQSAGFSWQTTVGSIKPTVFSEQYTVGSIRAAGFDEQLAVCNIEPSVFSQQYSVSAGQSIENRLCVTRGEKTHIKAMNIASTFKPAYIHRLKRGSYNQTEIFTPCILSEQSDFIYKTFIIGCFEMPHQSLDQPPKLG